jgi:hypothetical protein
MITNFFSPLSFVTVFGSGIRDPRSRMGKNQDPGSEINIPDPPHCKTDNLKSLHKIKFADFSSFQFGVFTSDIFGGF